MTPGELEEAILGGDLDGVVALLSGATEGERAASAQVPDAVSDRLTAHWAAVRADRQTTLTREQAEAVTSAKALAVLGTAARPEIHQAFHTDYARGARVLADRRPRWLEKWVSDAVRQFPPCWPLMRRLEELGAIERPEGEFYAIGLICGAHNDPALLEHPRTVSEDVWLLFETEGTSEHSLANYDRWTGKEKSWSSTLVRWAAEGRISRERLLDASLDALARDFIQYRAAWYSRFHETLAPTVDERTARLDRYLALLSSSIPPTVSFALKALAMLDQAGRLPAELLVAQAAPALAAREKGTVTQALKLLDRAAKRSPEVADHAAQVAVEALLHPMPEVQAAALDFIERHGDRAGPALRRLLESRLNDVAASQRGRLEALLGAPEQAADGSGPDAVELSDLVARAGRIPHTWRALAGLDGVLEAATSGTFSAPALDLPFHRVPRLDSERRLRPIETLDELIDAYAALLETLEPPEELERVLDGLSRLCGERPADFDRRTGPLRKRASQIRSRNERSAEWLGLGAFDFATLALCWTSAQAFVRYQPENLRTEAFQRVRLQEVAARVAARKARPLLAMPTHSGGWIDPRVLVQRVRASDEWDRADAVQALLRLAPDHRAAARDAATDLRGELGDALRHALGVEGVAIRGDAALWAAAARARNPLADDLAVDRAQPGVGPDTGLAARIRLRVEHESRVYDGTTYHYYSVHADTEPPPPEQTQPELTTVQLFGDAGHTAESRRWSALIWPACRRSWFARGAEVIGGNLDWWEAEWPNRVYLEALLDPDTPLCELGRWLLCLGLAAKEPGEAGLSVDALIAAVADGRLDGPRLGETLAALAGTGMIKGARWAKTLGEGARAAALHLEVVREALVALLASAPPFKPADLVALLTLSHELCVESGAVVENEAALRFLSGIKTGKSGAIAKGLAALSPAEHCHHRQAAAVTALEGRVERAERWARFSAA